MDTPRPETRDGELGTQGRKKKISSTGEVSAITDPTTLMELEQAEEATEAGKKDAE